MDGREIARRIELLAGVGLVVFGGLFALTELAGGGSAWGLVWPLFVVVPGLLLLAGVFVFGRGGGFLAIPGCIVTAGGLLLLVTNSLGLWNAWSYLWALVAPGAVGLGLVVFGTRSRLPELVRVGRFLAVAGLVLTAGFGALFELVFGVSGPLGLAIGRVLWPVALIAAGVWIIARQLRRR